jgi:hypothetical protein
MRTPLPTCADPPKTTWSGNRKPMKDPVTPGQDITQALATVVATTWGLDHPVMTSCPVPPELASRVRAVNILAVYPHKGNNEVRTVIR